VAPAAAAGSDDVKTRLCVAAVAALIIWGLKRHYADARPDDLTWILTPTAQLVGVVTGTTFALQPEEGYFSRDRLFLIEKSCAGINFMIAAFGMLVVVLFHRVRSVTSAAQVLGVSLLASYSAAVLVNAVRIAIAMWLVAHPAVLPAISAADVHRVEGIVVYFGGLVLLYELARRLDGGLSIVHRFQRVALPLTAYYIVTLAIPFANGSARSSAFAGHALAVIVVPVVVVVVWWALQVALVPHQRGLNDSRRCGFQISPQLWQRQ
jgi:exosortase K